MADKDSFFAGELNNITKQLRRDFSEGNATLAAYPKTQQALKLLENVLFEEKGVEAHVHGTARGGIGIDIESAVKTDANVGTGRSICVMVDGSENSIYATKWAAKNLIGADDDIHLVHVYYSADFIRDAERILGQAFDICQNGKVPAERIHTMAIEALPAGVGVRLQEFVSTQHVDTVVCGHRGMGSIKRSLMSMVGLGSVSEYCVQKLNCAVIVVKLPPEAGQ